MSNFLNKFRYNGKRMFAIIFLSLAIALEIGDFILGLVDSIFYGVSSLSFIWNFAILMFCYVTMLQGNLQNTFKAYSGVLMFIYMSAFTLLVDVVYSIFNMGFSGGGTGLIIQIVVFVLTAGELTLGIFSSIYTRRLIYNFGRTSLKTVKLLTGFFFGLLILSQGFSIGLTIYLGYGIISLSNIFLLLLSPISEVFAGIGAWITLARID